MLRLRTNFTYLKRLAGTKFPPVGISVGLSLRVRAGSH